MQRAALVGLAIASILSACTGTTASPSSTPDRLADLRRPLRATELSSSGACPVDHGIYAAEFPGSQGFAPGIGYVAYGPGPVAPAIMASPEAAALSFTNGSDLELAGPGTYPAGYVYFPKPECYTFQVDHSHGTQRVTLLVGP